MVSRLTKSLSLSYSFPTIGRRQTSSSFPEVQLLALLVVAVKLHHPFDGTDRHASTLTDLGVMTIDWDVWCKNQKEFDARVTLGGKIGRGNEMKVRDRDVLNMTGDQMDEYLDWYERTWVKEGNQETRKGGLPTQLLDMFPIGRIDGSSAPVVDVQELVNGDQEALDAKLKAVQGSLKIRGILLKEKGGKSKERVRRIGSFYKRFRKEKDFPPQAKTFYEAAANLIGISFHALLIAVLHTEQKLFNYRRRQLKEGSAETSDEEASDKSQVNGEDEVMEDTQGTSDREREHDARMAGFAGLTHRDIERLETLDIDASSSETSRMQIDSE